MRRLRLNLCSMHWLYAIQETGFSIWVRESDWALFAALIVHTLSMGLLLGTAAAIDLRMLGFGAPAPLPPLAIFAPMLHGAAWVSVVSGAVLVAGYPAKAALNPLFYIKLALLIAALVITRALWQRGGLTPGGPIVSSPVQRRFAIGSLLLMVLALIAGKFLAHTAQVLLLLP